MIGYDESHLVVVKRPSGRRQAVVMQSSCRRQFKKELISCQIVAVGNNAAASYVKTKTTQSTKK